MIGTGLNHYRITAILGSGGMGEVYAAEDTKLKREVGIKLLPPAVADNTIAAGASSWKRARSRPNAVTADGQRFVVAASVDETRPINVVLNWPASLQTVSPATR